MFGKMQKKLKILLPVVLIVNVVFLVFLPTLNNGFVWDDNYDFVENIDFRGLSPAYLKWMFTTFHYENYHPLPWLTCGFDFVLWEVNPAGYHLTNLVLHVLNSKCAKAYNYVGFILVQIR